MMDRLTALPFFVVLMGLGALAMLVPAIHAVVLDDYVTMRVFFYGAVLFSILTLMIGLTTISYAPENVARSQLMALFASFTALPMMFAVPFAEAHNGVDYLDAWFEMVSCFTTTGATLYDDTGQLTPSLHVWRGMVGWMGGLLIWVTAVSIFAPMNLGGFEVRATGSTGRGAATHFRQIARIADPSERLARYTAQLFPIYTGLTFLLWLALASLGEVPYVALVHAMSVMSSSGVSAIGGLYYAASGVWGEVVIFLFFVFALSRLAFSRGIVGEAQGGLLRDPEFKTALVLIGGSTVLLFGRHFFGAIAEDQNNISQGLAAVWGTVFTVTSFLTTTGFESRFWDSATAWSGLETPGLFLVGMALIGGGVATTAGGVKLLRICEARRIRRKGAYISWIFFMLFAISVAVVMLLLSLTGVQFETAMVLSVSALSTTGPLANIAAESPILYAGLPDMTKLILAAAMVLGRLEALAIIALFNPEIWRK